ncbi:hypothetical protein [Streptomyces sp. A1547]|uniref:hypothetical protein n=1 Tax=Streptomyces sp. A1547 TaxID=2563105 RepID=UPI00109E88A1|nr:hypothetical protein [Streptomyces sp. A1547]THA37300.1 hypothetical protein E6W17_21075 [Streptomyces sp. A1547]
MRNRHTVKARGGAAVAVAAVLALALAGCGGADDGKSKEPQKSVAANPQGATPQSPATGGSVSPAPTQVLATANGEDGMVMTINSATRDAGGFLTISGQFKNGGSADYAKTAAWRGNELTQSGTSIAGVTVTDKVGKKRYYVLRDTDGRCLCTTGIALIERGTMIPFFAQFPAPPTSTSEVDFSLPTFASATIKISG